MDEFYSIISKETGMSVESLKENWLIEECLNERYRAWSESNKNPFYIDMATEDVYSVI
jgi:hypothetical protein